MGQPYPEGLARNRGFRLYSWSSQYYSLLLLILKALAARAHAKYVFPVPAGPMPKTISFFEWCRCIVSVLGLSGFPMRVADYIIYLLSSIKTLAFCSRSIR